MSKYLGYIENAEFGRASDVGFMFGLMLVITVPEHGIANFNHYMVNTSENCKNKEAVDKAILDYWRTIYALLDDAKVSSVSELKGVPVEVDCDTKINNFRILTEVIPK
ncbi:hypothetical protein LFYK43_10870 [Ligilactobacillus salitolerans]|uniref:Uncharacterized protein n=1 Tax=Ligilactobacillus salitolerans TaxID=1808352 RepID=A0A401ISX7_9LACO|nr:hypothetical protein [Ligilactobacillus salitolerans]GBG94628.1 hypothetical protein LFYK43_10870 [Ligilactobacillus salitolerans]